jgi:hypothetical protein
MVYLKPHLGTVNKMLDKTMYRESLVLSIFENNILNTIIVLSL